MTNRRILAAIFAATITTSLGLATAAPAAAADDGWSCPAGTEHVIKLDNLGGASFTVPNAPSGWEIQGVSIKAGPDHHNYPSATSGAVLSVKADTGHDVSHAHLCKRRTITTTSSTTTTLPETTTTVAHETTTTSMPTTTTSMPDPTTTDSTTTTSLEPEPLETTTTVPTVCVDYTDNPGCNPNPTCTGICEPATIPTTTPEPCSTGIRNELGDCEPVGTPHCPDSQCAPDAPTPPQADPDVGVSPVGQQLPATGNNLGLIAVAFTLIAGGLTATRIARRNDADRRVGDGS